MIPARSAASIPVVTGVKTRPRQKKPPADASGHNIRFLIAPFAGITQQVQRVMNETVHFSAELHRLPMDTLAP